MNTIDKKNPAQKSFFRRLIGCRRGDGVVEKLVLIGLAVTAAAGAAKVMQGGTDTASKTIATRTEQGGAGVVPAKGQ